MTGCSFFILYLLIVVCLGPLMSNWHVLSSLRCYACQQEASTNLLTQSRGHCFNGFTICVRFLFC